MLDKDYIKSPNVLKAILGDSGTDVYTGHILFPAPGNHATPGWHCYQYIVSVEQSLLVEATVASFSCSVHNISGSTVHFFWS